MKSNVPYWRKLLEYKVTVKETGFSIPFLIGAKEYCNEPHLISINELISEIINYKDRSALYFCYKTKTIIVTSSPNFLNAPDDYYYLIFKNLIIHRTNNLNGIREIEHIIEVLEIDYDEPIKTKKYDRVDEKWVFFTESKIKMICDILKTK